MTFLITPEIEYRIERVREHLKQWSLDRERLAAKEGETIALKIAIEDVEFLLDLVENSIPPLAASSAAASTPDTSREARYAHTSRDPSEPAETPTS